MLWSDQYDDPARPAILTETPARGCVYGVPLGLLLWGIGLGGLYGLVSLARDLAAALGWGR